VGYLRLKCEKEMLTMHLRYNIGVGMPASCRMASRGSSSLDLESCVGGGPIGFATPGVGLPASCPMS
jgi:hypothetical protein